MDADLELTPPDPVARAIEEVNALLTSRRVDPAGAAAWLSAIESCGPRELARFDQQARAYLAGVQWSAVQEPARWRRSSAAAVAVWGVVAMSSPDGYQRERTVRTAELRPVVVRLVVLRCVDWVAEVRGAALERLDAIAPAQLLPALSLAEQLATERGRGQILSSFIATRLRDEDLLAASHNSDALTRRAAWARLLERNAATGSDLVERAAHDPDIVVRAITARVLDDPAHPASRQLAEELISDRSGPIAARALAALVALDGTRPIITALTARTAAVRRAARGWASVKGIDARAVYHQRLSIAPDDPMALVALAEISSSEDRAVFEQMLNSTRVAVRAAGLRALARVDRTAGRVAALQALDHGASGRVSLAAAAILRQGTPSHHETEVLSNIALDPGTDAHKRWRCTVLLRPARWRHLGVLLRWRSTTNDEQLTGRLDQEIKAWVQHNRQISKAPESDLRDDINAGLQSIDAGLRREIEFAMRTTS